MPANPVVQNGHPKGSYSETHRVNQPGVGLTEMARTGANCCLRGCVKGLQALYN